MRYQQVFAASQFSGAMPIGQLALRNANFDPQPFTDTIASVEISLSTVAANPDQLSTTFANNIGADNTEVYDGALTLSSTNAAGPGNTHVFDVLITFQRTFYYDPSQGNLLLEVKNNSGTSRQSYFFDGIFFDAANVVGDSVSRVIGPEFNPNATATSGTADSLGLIIRFDSVPEPSSLCLTGLGVALFAWRRLRPRSGTASESLNTLMSDNFEGR
jgi:hypothetical protein